MKRRLALNALLLISVFCLPWWLVLFVGVIGAFVLAPYYEIFAFGLLFDLLYGSNSSSWFGLMGFVVATVLFLLMIRLKKSVRASS